MGAQLRVYKQKISSAQTTKKITKAMELIAASRIQKAMGRVSDRPLVLELDPVPDVETALRAVVDLPGVLLLESCLDRADVSRYSFLAAEAEPGPTGPSGTGLTEGVPA